MLTTSGVVTKPNPQDAWLPTNTGLWERVNQLAQGELKEIKGKDTVYHALRDGAGFKQWPSPRATGWCVRIYNLMGGRWRKQGETRSVLLTGNMIERVTERHQTKLAKMLGEDIRRSMCRYQSGPDLKWNACAGCAHWVATASKDEAEVRPGTCLRHLFATVELGWCPAHLLLDR